MLTRLSGSAFVLNADLIERLDCTPDTVVTLIDGKKYVVSESMAEITALVRTWRGEVVAAGSHLGASSAASVLRPAHLAPVTNHPSSHEEDA